MKPFAVAGYWPNTERMTSRAIRTGFVLALAPLLCLLALPAFSFNPPTDTVGPLTARIEGPDEVTATEAETSIKLILTNTGPVPVEGTAQVSVIDDWRITPDSPLSFSVEAASEIVLNYTVVAGNGTFSALYPIHAHISGRAGETSLQLHPILMVTTSLSDAPRPLPHIPWKTTEIGPNSETGLWHTALSRVAVQLTGRAPILMPMGWRGTEPSSFATVMAPMSVDRGGARTAVGMHPPWKDGCDGIVLFEAPLVLPDQSPIRLRFAVAIRDNDILHNEPPSDGVTFRVRVVSFDAPDGQLGELVYEQNTATKRWMDAEVNLDRFAGKALRLQFESHPGPNNDKTCDQCFWAEPVLTVGTPEAPSASPAGPRRDLGVIERNGTNYSIAVQPGTRGLLDAEVHFISDDADLAFAGFSPQVLGLPLARHQVLCPLIAIQEEPGSGYRIRHIFRSSLGTFDLIGDLRVEDGALKAGFHLENTPAPTPWQVITLEDLSAGPWNAKVHRVYAGQGNVLVAPKAFSLEFDGHRLATSYVGFDFANGITVLQASDVPPERLEVTPETGICSLHVSETQTVCYVPAKSSWEAALAYRDIDKRQAAGGVNKVAGRFVFDLWGGSFSEQQDNLQKAFQYGLTDTMVVWHNWQRWGYDYRLPEVWPPNPQVGTAAEFRALADLCRQHNVIFAPHDNYIDFYPDADQFSYDHISFTQDGAPIRGWLNEGREAQAFRWRPDRIRPFLEANVAQLRDGLAPTGFFIDVWSSMGPHAYWTRDGQYFSKTQTRETWGELFAWIRDYLGDQAPQISESGHDQLIGWLDGAQTNHLRVDAHAKDWTTWPVTCSDAERIPWMDAVHHDRFILHGAGYGNRYQGGLDADLHGIYSDDYLATEVMTGHPAMVDNAFGRDVVRKYWLLHDLMRGLALQRIDWVDFVDNDIHRQHIRWDNSTEIWVNRGDSDWSVNGHVLPQYGFHARGPGSEAAIERIDGIVTDWARGDDALYVNARPDGSGRLPISVQAAASALHEGVFDLTLNWTAGRGTDEPMSIFVHFLDKNGAIKFQGDHDGAQATTDWKGTFATACTVRIPEEARPGDTFDVRTGLYSAATSHQALLASAEGGERSVRLGTLSLTGPESTVTGITWTPLEPAVGPSPRLARLNPDGKAIAFGALTTNGACRVARNGSMVTVRPLPDSAEFQLSLNWAKLAWGLAAPTRIQAIGLNGKTLDTVAVQREGDVVTLACKPGVFEYQLIP